jgi:DegV family protein with EDD domain
VDVTVFDSRSVSLGSGFLAETAAREAANGASLARILDVLQAQARRTHVVAMLDLLEYLQRSGRMSGAVAGLGQMLRFKPLLRVHDGQSTAESIRTRERATDRLVQILADIGPLERAGIVHSNAPERVDDLQLKAGPLLPPGDVPVVDITPVVGVHTGPGAVGFACVAKG